MEEKNSRRNFLKETALAGASLLVAPSLLRAAGVNSITNGTGKGLLNGAGDGSAQGNGGADASEGEPGSVRGGDLIVPKDQGLKITGTFLDEISHDIPHQNWGVKEWDRDFRNMKAIGIDTVIIIRSGYRKFLTYPSPYLLKKGCYMPSVDLVEMFLTLADKYGMKFYFGLYDSGKYWDTGDMSYEVESNKFVIDEVWKMYGSRHKSFQGWYISGDRKSTRLNSSH